jgi:hypothetical protein
MKQSLRAMLLVVLAACTWQISSAQNVTQVEYFFDTDPGFGNGTQVTITPSTNIVSLAFSANVASLTNGMHTLFVRSKDANGVWSITNNMPIAKVQPVFANPHSATNIVKAEYFYDTDPGFGLGTDIPVTPALNIPSLLFNANVTALAAGMHTLYVRTKDANGQWSITNNYVFAKVQAVGTNPHSTSNIVKAEYFYDTDPGYGNGTDVPVTLAVNIPSLVFNASVGALTSGMHTLYVRTKDANGLWSIANNYVFAKVQPVGTNPNTLTNIVKLEYFFNTDPGFNNGIDVPVTAGLNIAGFVFNAPVSSLPTGLHTLYVRSRDAQGKWSITNTFQFSRIQGVGPNPHTITNINKVEYFYDTDPGFGNGTDIPVVAGTNIASLTFNADVSTLTNGVHALYVRARDAQGQWSVVNSYSFAKVQPVATNPNTISNIDKAEYFYDTDPGFGNGVNIPVVAASNISSLAFNTSVAALAPGVHTLYVRTRDAQGKWSVVNNLVFAKVQGLSPNPHTVSNVTNIEYFVDTDPGIGNGTPVPVTPALDITNATFNVDMTVLVNAPHHLYVRSKDAQGKWSITYVHSFVGGTAPLAIKLVSFEAMLQKDNTVKLEWITEMEKDVAKYTIERSYDAAKWEYVGEKLPIGSNSIGRKTYQLLDENPGEGIVYYRLTETDLNAKDTRAPIRLVHIGKQDKSYASVFPNPNNGKLINIATDMFAEGEVVITLMSSDGKIHLRQNVEQSSAKVLSISSLELASGSYFVNLKGKNRSESLKLQIAGSHP